MKNASTATLAAATILLLLAEPSSAALQTGQSGLGNQGRLGMTSAWPIGVLLVEDNDDDNRYRTDGEIYVRAGGTNGQIAQAWSSTGISPDIRIPDYSTVHIVSLDTETVALEIDAHSTNNARFPAFVGSGHPFTGAPLVNSGFFGFVASIAAGETGESDGPFQMSSTEVAGYYFSGSSGIDATYPGNTFPEFSRRSLAMRGRPDAQVRAIDFGVGFASYPEVNVPVGLFFQSGADYFFSVTPAFANEMNSAGNTLVHHPQTSQPHDLHPGDIYLRQWSNNQWGPIELALTYDQLRLSTEGDVDALELDTSNATVIFSAANAGGQFNESYVAETSQFMVCVLGTIGPGSDTIHGPKPFREGVDGQKVTTKLGIRDGGDPHDSDNVGGACGIDPESIGGALKFGIPIAINPLPVPKMSMSISRGGWQAPLQGPGVFNAGTMSIDVSGWGTSTPASQPVYLYRRLRVESTWHLYSMLDRKPNQDRVTFYIENLEDKPNAIYHDYYFRAYMPSTASGLTESVTSLILMAE